ncbi:copper resistance D family protein [Streptomyces massasporeus]|uniref:copper resistance D family protein n=1 Tax=Streptomyces massasporeus TaxID=67324 RepID=UPI0033C30A2C
MALVSSVLHLLAMAVWLGGLTALLRVLYRAPAEEPLPSAAVARFSRLAFASVAVLTATGVYQSWRRLGSWEAFTTSYGRLLALKIGSVVLMLTAASYSRELDRAAADRAPGGTRAGDRGRRRPESSARPGAGRDRCGRGREPGPAGEGCAGPYWPRW